MGRMALTHAVRILFMTMSLSICLDCVNASTIWHTGRYKTQVTGHRSGHRSQGTGHRAQGTGYRAQGIGHRSQKTQ